MVLRNYNDKVKRYFGFSRVEQVGFLIATLVLGLIFSWNEWGGVRFDLTSGLKNLLIGIVIMCVTIFVHHAAQRLVALQLGFKVTHRVWWYGLLTGIIAAMVSGGKLRVFAATSFVADLLPIHRLGAFRYGPNVASIAKIAIAGPAANILFAGLVKTFLWTGVLGPVLSEKLFYANVGFALWNLIPIPPLDGAFVLYYSRVFYVYILSAIVSYAAIAFVFAFYSYVLALVIGAVLTVIISFIFEGL